MLCLLAGTKVTVQCSQPTVGLYLNCQTLPQTLRRHRKREISKNNTGLTTIAQFSTRIITTSNHQYVWYEVHVQRTSE